MQRKSIQCPFTICDIRCCDGNSMRQSLCVHRNMTLNPRHFLTRIIAFVCCGIRILDTLCINDAKARFVVAPLLLSGLCNLIFLMPARAGLILLRSLWYSIAGNTHVRYAILGSHLATFATDSHSLITDVTQSHSAEPEARHRLAGLL